MAMSALTKAELDTLLSQLIEQTLPERPSDAEAERIVRWAESTRIDHGILEMVLEGDATVRIEINGTSPSFLLTPQGMAKAEHLIATNRDAADLQARLVASMVGKTAIPEPEDEQ
jgi:hypothetical protein